MIAQMTVVAGLTRSTEELTLIPEHRGTEQLLSLDPERRRAPPNVPNSEQATPVHLGLPSDLPPPPDQSDHHRKTRISQKGKSCWAIFRTQTFGSQIPPSPPSNTSLVFPPKKAPTSRPGPATHNKHLASRRALGPCGIHDRTTVTFWVYLLSQQKAPMAMSLKELFVVNLLLRSFVLCNVKVGIQQLHSTAGGRAALEEKGLRGGPRSG